MATLCDTMKVLTIVSMVHNNSGITDTHVGSRISKTQSLEKKNKSLSCTPVAQRIMKQL